MLFGVFSWFDLLLLGFFLFVFVFVFLVLHFLLKSYLVKNFVSLSRPEFFDAIIIYYLLTFLVLKQHLVSSQQYIIDSLLKP